jgi:integrase
MRTEALLTPHMLASLKPQAKDYAIFDARCPTLAIRVEPGGSKSWVTWERTSGKSRRVTLGRMDDLTLEKARGALLSYNATQAVTKIDRCITFAELVRIFMAAKRKVYRPDTIDSLQSYLKTQLLPAFGKVRTDRITTPEVADWFHGYSRTMPGGANQALLHFTTILNWGKENGHIPFLLPNPASPLRKNRRVARGQMLNSSDLNRLFNVLATPTSRNKEAASVIELVLLTGCRSGEIVRLRWDEVKSTRLDLAQTKTGARTVLLNDLAIERLKERRRTRSSAFVFPSPYDPAKPRTAPTCAWQTIKEKAGLPPNLRLHDLRHTYASHAILGGESLYITGRLLGHHDAQSTERYAHLSGAALAAASEKISIRIEKLLVGRS